MSAQAVAEAGKGHGRLRIGQKVRQVLVRDLKKNLTDVETVVVFKTQNVSTRDLNALRDSLKNLQSNLFVVKNSLGAVAFQELGWEELKKQMVGTCGVTPIRGDVAAVAKVLATFSKDHEGFVLQGGILKGTPLSSQEIVTLSRLPSREVLLSQLAGIVQSPLRKLAFGLSGPIRSFVLVVSAVSKKKEGESQDGKRNG